MNKMLVIVIVMTTIIFACHKKNSPTITSRNATPPQKTSTVYPPVSTIIPDTIMGKGLYTMHCNKCHGLPELSLYAEKRWDRILAIMLPKTNMNNDEATHVRAFVLANAK
jgi:hypothetical protein